MTDHHIRKTLTWRPATSVAEFIRADAKRQGLRISEWLTILVAKEELRRKGK